MQRAFAMFIIPGIIQGTFCNLTQTLLNLTDKRTPAFLLTPQSSSVIFPEGLEKTACCHGDDQRTRQSLVGQWVCRQALNLSLGKWKYRGKPLDKAWHLMWSSVELTGHSYLLSTGRIHWPSGLCWLGQWWLCAEKYLNCAIVVTWVIPVIIRHRKNTNWQSDRKGNTRGRRSRKRRRF